MNCFKIQSVSCYRYVLVRGLINEDEMKKLKYALENSEDIRNNVQERSDGDGAISKLCLWNYAGNDVTGVMARYSDIQNLLVKFVEVQTP